MHAAPLLAGEWSALLPAPAAQAVQGHSTNHTLIVVAWNGPATQPVNVAIRCYDGPVSLIQDPPSDGTKHVRITEDFRELGLRFWRLWQRPLPAEVAGDDNRRLDRALRYLARGDPTFVREQSVETWYVTAWLSDATPYVPRSLRSRVRSAVVETELDLTECRGRLRLYTVDNDTAEQVGRVVAGWRELALSLTEGVAGGGLAERLRQTLIQQPVRVLSNQVLFEATVPVGPAIQIGRKVVRHALSNEIVSATCPWPADATEAVLRKGLDSPDPILCAEAVLGLGRRQATIPATELHRLLAHPDEHVRGATAHALLLLGDRSEAELVRPLLEDRHPFVRAVAADCLSRWGDKTVKPPAGFDAAEVFGYRF